MTSTIRAEIAVNGPQEAAQGRVTSRPETGKTADHTPTTLNRICTWGVRRRYELAPATANATVTGLAWAQHLAGVTDTTCFAYTAGTLTLGAITGWALHKDRTKLALAAGTAAAATAEAGLNAMAGPGITGLIATAITTVGTYAFYAPWLLKHRRTLAATNRTGNTSTTLAGSPAMAGPIDVGTIGLADQPLAPAEPASRPEELALHHGLAALGITPLAVDNFTLDSTGWQATVTLPPGKNTSPAAVKAQRSQLFSNMGLTGRLRLLDGPRSNQLIAKVQLHDPLADAVPWPGPTITSIRQPMSLGVFQDGETIQFDLTEDHILIGGATNSGKSGVENVILGNLAACHDAVILGIDMKPGALELGPWEDTMLMLADDADGATEVFASVDAEMRRRGKYLATLRGPDGERVRKWVAGDPNAPEHSEEWGHGPFWFLVIDELAELMRQAPDLAKELISINQVARAMGIRVVAATQSPSAQAFGGKGTDARQQYGTRIGLGVSETLTVNLILGQGAYGAGWALDDLDKPGKLMISNNTTHKHPREGRCYWASDAQIHAVSKQYAGQKTPTPPGGPGGRFLKSVPTFPDGTRIPNNRVGLWQAIDQRGAAGVTINGLLGDGLDGLNARTAISDPIQTWKARGWVVEIGQTEDRSKLFALARHVKAA